MRLVYRKIAHSSKAGKEKKIASHPDWISEGRPLQLGHLRGHGGAEQECAAFPGQHAQYFVDLLLEVLNVQGGAGKTKHKIGEGGGGDCKGTPYQAQNISAGNSGRGIITCHGAFIYGIDGCICHPLYSCVAHLQRVSFGARKRDAPRVYSTDSTGYTITIEKTLSYYRTINMHQR